MLQQHIELNTTQRGTYDITSQVNRIIQESGVETGLCHIFIQHTSASLIFCENADPSVRRDLEAFFARLVPDGDPAYEHDAEGPDDMPAHIRNVMTHSSVTVPINQGRCALGVWQGLFLWEHRYSPQRRRVIVTVQS